MPSYKSVLIGRQNIAEGTMAFDFQKPSGFTFRAGQAIDLSLVNPPESDSEGDTRAFSITSIPSDDQLSIATRMRDTAFKRVLATMPIGTEVKIEGPSGSFTLHRNAQKPAVFLAGGIGITPFHSIVKEAAHEHLSQKLFLFYSNRRPEDAPFIDELRALATASKNFHFIPTMTGLSKSKSKWEGEVGLLNREMIARHLADLRGPIYYLAGPPAMVTAMRQLLVSANVDEDDIRTEEFSGY